MKLADWARKQGISYLTAYRWFKDGKLPVEAYQSESGTIIVQDNELDSSEQTMQEDIESASAVAHFLKKTIECSKANTSIEDFAAFILSNYRLEMQSSYAEKFNVPKVKAKPTPEMAANYFNKFLPKNKKPETNMFLMDKETLDQIISNDSNPNVLDLLKQSNIIEQPVNRAVMQGTDVSEMASEMQTQISTRGVPESLHKYEGMSAGVFGRTDVQNYGSVVSSIAPALNSNMMLNTVESVVGAAATFDSSGGSPAPTAYYSSALVPSEDDLTEWRSVFEEAKADPDFKIFTHQGLNLAPDYRRTYDEARKLTDLMLAAGLIPKNDMIVIDRQAKEICAWPETAFKSMEKVAIDIVNNDLKKVAEDIKKKAAKRAVAKKSGPTKRK